MESGVALNELQQKLFTLRDEKYRDFTAGLIPTADRESILGVRIPVLRALAKEITGTEAAAFLGELPHRFHEENCLHAFLIERIRDYDACVEELNAFLPYVDNWAVCDCMNPPCLRRKPEKLLEDARRWMDSGELYTVRFGLRMLMAHFLDGSFRPEVLEWAAGIETDEYYLRMMQAWFFATALAKRWEETLPYIEGQRLEVWTHNRAIQKAVESRRVSNEHKACLQTLKRQAD